MTGKAVEKIRAIRDEMKETFLERADVVEGIILALISKHHVFLVGPPGTAKSMVAERACKKTGGRHFYALITRFSTPESVLGPISVKGLKEDNYRRITDGYLPDCEVASIDEIFKGSASLLNAMNSILNTGERKMANGREVIDVPLVTLVASSNEIPTDEAELLCVYDRFLFRYVTPYIAEPGHFRELLKMKEGAGEKMNMTMDDLKTLQDEAGEIEVGDDIIEKMLTIRENLNVEGVVASDRRWRESLSVLRARALVEGRDRVEDEDLEVLANILWTTMDGDEIRTVAKTVLSVANPELERIKDLELMAREAYERAMSAQREADKFTPGEESDEARDARRKALEVGIDAQASIKRGMLADMESVVEEAQEKGKNIERLEGSVQSVRGLLKEINKKVMGEL